MNIESKLVSRVRTPAEEEPLPEEPEDGEVEVEPELEDVLLPVAFWQVTLDGMVTLLDSVMSAHFESIISNYDGLETAK
jgi:hypothetical protein